MKLEIYPSLISGNLLNLEKTIHELEPYCAGFHLDVMDFHFVPNLTWGPAFINAIRRASKKTIWVDLLVERPEEYLERMSLEPNDIISIHYESTYNDGIFCMIRQKKCRVSLGINPETPVDAIIPFLDNIDQVLLMSVHPGFSGQAFLHESVQKIKQLHAIKLEKKRSLSIAMDGGLDKETLPLVIPFGLEMAGIASGIFNTHDPVQTLKLLGEL